MIMTGQAALEVVAGYLGDLDPTYLAEDVTLDLVAESQARVGRAAVAGWVHDVRHRLFTEVDHDVTGLHAVEGAVVAELTVSGRPVVSRWAGTVSGRRVTARAVAVLVVADGEIVQARVYYDTASLRRRPASLVPLS